MVVDQLRISISGVTKKAGEQVGALTSLLKQARKEVERQRKVRDPAIQELGELRKGKECVKEERNGSQANLQRLEREQDRYADVVNHVQSGFGDL